MDANMYIYFWTPLLFTVISLVNLYLLFNLNVVDRQRIPLNLNWKIFFSLFLSQFNYLQNYKY